MLQIFYNLYAYIPTKHDKREGQIYQNVGINIIAILSCDVRYRARGVEGLVEPPKKNFRACGLFAFALCGGWLLHGKQKEKFFIPTIF